MSSSISRPQATRYCSWDSSCSALPFFHYQASATYALLDRTRLKEPLLVSFWPIQEHIIRSGKYGWRWDPLAVLPDTDYRELPFLLFPHGTLTWLSIQKRPCGSCL